MKWVIKTLINLYIPKMKWTWLDIFFSKHENGFLHDGNASKNKRVRGLRLNGTALGNLYDVSETIYKFGQNMNKIVYKAFL